MIFRYFILIAFTNSLLFPAFSWPVNTSNDLTYSNNNPIVNERITSLGTEFSKIFSEIERLESLLEFRAHFERANIEDQTEILKKLQTKRQRAFAILNEVSAILNPLINNKEIKKFETMLINSKGESTQGLLFVSLITSLVIVLSLGDFVHQYMKSMNLSGLIEISGVVLASIVVGSVLISFELIGALKLHCKVSENVCGAKFWEVLKNNKVPVPEGSQETKVLWLWERLSGLTFNPKIMLDSKYLVAQIDDFKDKLQKLRTELAEETPERADLVDHIIDELFKIKNLSNLNSVSKRKRVFKKLVDAKKAITELNDSLSLFNSYGDLKRFLNETHAYQPSAFQEIEVYQDFFNKIYTSNSISKLALQVIGLQLFSGSFYEIMQYISEHNGSVHMNFSFSTKVGLSDVLRIGLYRVKLEVEVKVDGQSIPIEAEVEFTSSQSSEHEFINETKWIIPLLKALEQNIKGHEQLSAILTSVKSFEDCSDLMGAADSPTTLKMNQESQ